MRVTSIFVIEVSPYAHDLLIISLLMLPWVKVAPVPAHVSEMAAGANRAGSIFVKSKSTAL